jgi:hypothetical protein
MLSVCVAAAFGDRQQLPHALLLLLLLLLLMVPQP